MSRDIEFMAQALQLARLGVYSTSPNPRVGCVLVKNDRVIATGWHQLAGGPHAEIHALREAGVEARGSTAYVTLEPCNHTGRTGPCSVALIEAGVARVVCASTDPNPLVAGGGIERLRAAGISVENGVLEAQARALNPGFIKRMTSGLPWVRVKLAQSLDGRTAMASGESQWITGADARRDVQRWRARSCAVLTGSGTVKADNPSLTVRESLIGFKPVRQPLRVVLDRQLSTDPLSHVYDDSAPTLIVSAVTDAGDCYPARVETCHLPSSESWLREVLIELGRRGYNEIMIEAGATLAGAFMGAGLVDELIVYTAPKLLGSGARPLMTLPLVSMAEAVALELTDLRQVGVDIRLIYQIKEH
ncbi:bifunctional diaminohydroxyphosphoribosylaminopyrimidine deaminase/5-amino-6-(5-phosphoribosylamino)uracil reductase RibD [Gynuella sp.]|uniref:bifunctional diaminohydroxyphosphoribosylaminopyrimidine deaminase/5-amino-6-(5-phosphoribosylamino)uracil reductase RibD n=1 Tax=Gynuella sp. TaxID=2969146 RepID=UPI003D10EB65